MDDNQEVDSLENVEAQPFVDYARKKRLILILLLAYSAILGVLHCFLPEGFQVENRLSSCVRILTNSATPKIEFG